MKFRKKYSIKFKLKCIDLANIVGIYKTSIIIGVDKKSVRNWYFKREQLKNIVKQNSTYRLPGGGCKLKYPNKGKEIMFFILKCNEIGIILNMKLIIEECFRICPEMKNYSYILLRKWIYRFLKRNNYHINNFK